MLFVALDPTAALREQLGDVPDELSDVELDYGNLEAALAIAQEAYQLAHKIQNLKELTRAAELMQRVSYQQGEFQTAYRYQAEQIEP